MHTLQTLQLLGLDPQSESARRAIALIAENGRWEHDGQRYFDGEVEPCINGRTVETGAYFGVDVAPLVERLLGERMADGGWNCEQENGSVRSSFDTTINVLDGLLMFELVTGGTPAVREARRGGEEYLLARALLRRASTGDVVDPAYLDAAFPYYWHYDVLRALDYFRGAGERPDPRMAEAVEHVRSRQQPDGRWLLDRTHEGTVFFDLEPVGEPSRWNTLRALRVLALVGRRRLTRLSWMPRRRVWPPIHHPARARVVPSRDARRRWSRPEHVRSLRRMTGRTHPLDTVPGLRELARAQRGVVRRDQLRELGVLASSRAQPGRGAALDGDRHTGGRPHDRRAHARATPRGREWRMQDRHRPWTG